MPIARWNATSSTPAANLSAGEISAVDTDLATGT